MEMDWISTQFTCLTTVMDFHVFNLSTFLKCYFYAFSATNNVGCKTDLGVSDRMKDHMGTELVGSLFIIESIDKTVLNASQRKVKFTTFAFRNGIIPW